MSTERPKHRQRLSDDIVSAVFTTTMVIVAIAYITTRILPLLMIWQAVGVAYLIVVFTRMRNRVARGGPESQRILPGRALEYVTWSLPLAASATGVASAVTLLTSDSAASFAGQPAFTAGILGSVGVIVAWLLLQTGFAEIYEAIYERLPDADFVTFPGSGVDATLSDSLYLAFTIGTSFAPSGATVASRKIRRVIMLHSVTSFFYNAFLIAVAIQVLQGIIANS